MNSKDDGRVYPGLYSFSPCKFINIASEGVVDVIEKMVGTELELLFLME